MPLTMWQRSRHLSPTAPLAHFVIFWRRQLCLRQKVDSVPGMSGPLLLQTQLMTHRAAQCKISFVQEHIVRRSRINS
eukprot:4261598-Amphidinium_carterae.1